jgi:hypothetical protein
MLRSSRIPDLLNRICTDGIVSSYLITKDGELLGCSNTQPQNVSSIPVNTSSPNLVDNEEIPSTWENMDPSDIGALVAEVVEDYNRFGSELALLNFSDVSAKQANTTGGAVSNTSGKENNSSKERGRLNCLIVEMEKVRRMHRTQKLVVVAGKLLYKVITFV